MARTIFARLSQGNVRLLLPRGLPSGRGGHSAGYVLHLPLAAGAGIQTVRIVVINTDSFGVNILLAL